MEKKCTSSGLIKIPKLLHRFHDEGLKPVAFDVIITATGVSQREWGG